MSFQSSLSKFSRPAFICAGLFISVLLGGCFSSDPDLGSTVVLRVNEDELTLKEFSNKLAQKLRGLDALTVKDSSTLNRAKKDLIRNFITQSLSNRWAKQKNIFVRKEQLEAEISSIRNFYPDDLAFRRALAAQNMSFSAWKSQLRFSLLQRLIIKELGKAVREPNNEEMLSYYNNHRPEFKQPEMVRISQIVLQKEVNAKRIASELKKKKSFKNLARKFSIMPEAQNDGDIGWIEKGTLDIFDKAFKMKVGRRSDVIKSPYGYHIFKVTGKRKARKQSFKDVKNKIKRNLIEKREQAIYASWLEKQIRVSRVFKDDGLISSLSVVTRRD